MQPFGPSQRRIHQEGRSRAAHIISGAAEQAHSLQNVGSTPIPDLPLGALSR